MSINNWLNSNDLMCCFYNGSSTQIFIYCIKTYDQIYNDNYFIFIFVHIILIVVKYTCIIHEKNIDSF